jgi:DNA processing protein
VGHEGPVGPPPVMRLSDREALAVIVSVEGVGPITLERLLLAFGGPVAVLEAARRPTSARDLRAASRDPDGIGHPMTVGAAEALAVAAHTSADVLAAMHRAGVQALVLEDAAYPARLRLIELPPRVLFIRGEARALEAASVVAVVGTRRPTDAGRRTAARVGAALSRAGALVVSGLAVGIDGAAHAAVVAEGGLTVAVIGSGHEQLFPRSHDRLADAIVDGGGAVISEHAPGTLPTRGTFPRRNRIISGLSDAVVVVEAPARSGALLTASWALEQGRECFLVPGAIEARIVSGVPQLLEDLNLAPAAAFPAPPAAATGDLAAKRSRAATTVPPARPTRSPTAAAVRVELSPREDALAMWLSRGMSTADELVALTGLSIGSVLGGLTTLETAGLVVGTYGRYRPAGPLAAAGPEVRPGPADRAADPADEAADPAA